MQGRGLSTPRSRAGARERCAQDDNEKRFQDLIRVSLVGAPKAEDRTARQDPGLAAGRTWLVEGPWFWL